MWNRSRAAWSAYRHVAAIKGLLEWIGVWKYAVVVGGLAVVGLIGWLSSLPLWGRVLLGAVGLVVILFIAGFALAFFRMLKKPDDQLTLLPSPEPPPHGWTDYTSPYQFFGSSPANELLETECRVNWSPASTPKKLIAAVWNGTPRSSLCIVKLANIQRWSDSQQSFIDAVASRATLLFNFVVIRASIAPENSTDAVVLVKDEGAKFSIFGLERISTWSGSHKGEWKCTLSITVGNRKRSQNLYFRWSDTGLSTRPNGNAFVAARTLPLLVCHGIFQKLCKLPTVDDNNTLEFVSLPCTTVAFRNEAITHDGCAYGVVAHLDYFPDAGPPIAINEGWWCENQRQDALGFAIDRAETKHLVIAIDGGRWLPEGSQCYLVGKQYDHRWDRYMPTPILGSEYPLSLPEGRWRLRIHLVCEGLSEKVYYLIGNVAKDSESKWSAPSTTRPPEWGYG